MAGLKVFSSETPLNVQQYILCFKREFELHCIIVFHSGFVLRNYIAFSSDIMHSTPALTAIAQISKHETRLYQTVAFKCVKDLH